MPQLINLTQIKNGATIKDLVKKWEKGEFPANKVLTTIVKHKPTEEEISAGASKDPTYWNAEELFENLKSTVDSALGTGDKSVITLIDEAKKEVQNNVDAINNRKFSDYVKMTGIIDHDGRVTLNDPVNRDDATYQKEALAGLHENETLGVYDIDTGRDYVLYYDDNMPVRGKDGGNVTLRFVHTGPTYPGIGTGLTDALLAEEKKKNAKFSAYGSLVSDVPHIHDVVDSHKAVVLEGQELKKGREIILPNTNIVKGSLQVLHKHEYYVPGDGGPSLVSNWHDASIFHWEGTTDAAKKNKELFDAGKIYAEDYYFNGASGKILFKQDVTDTFNISYEYHDAKTGYVPDTRDGVAIKLFPVGTWSFEKLGKDYLLDNAELNLVAYNQALDELATKIASDEGLMEYVLSLVGTTEIQKALIAATEGITKQAETDKLDAFNHDVDIQNQLADVAYEVDQLVNLHVKQDRLDALKITVTDDAPQTVFDLSKVPSKKLVVLWINGVRYLENIHFTVDRDRKVSVGTSGREKAAPQLTWTFTAEKGGFDITKDDGFDLIAQYDLVSTKSSVVPMPYYTVETLNDKKAAEAKRKADYDAAVEAAKAAGTVPPAPYADLTARPYDRDVFGMINDSPSFVS